MEYIVPKGVTGTGKVGDGILGHTGAKYRIKRNVIPFYSLPDLVIFHGTI